MRDNLYGFAQVRALLILLAPLVVATTQRPEICGGQVPFLSSDSTWLADVHISKDATLESELKIILVDLSGCDVALGIHMSIGPHKLLDLFKRKN
jgi:hypothetical protein